MKIEIKIEPTRSVNWPRMRLMFNTLKLFDGECRPNDGDYFKWTHHADNNSLLDNNRLSIEHYGKEGKETLVDDEGEIISDRAVILRSITLDGYAVPEVVLFDKPFYVNWTSKQKKENIGRPEYIRNNLYFGHNGIYNYEFGKDTQKHYYLNLIEKERLANVANKKEIMRADGKVVEAFEFTGKLIEGSEKELITIKELYTKVQNAD